MNISGLFTFIIKKRMFLIIIVVLVLLSLAMYIYVMLLNHNGLVGKSESVRTDIPVSQDPTNRCMVVPVIAIFQELG